MVKQLIASSLFDKRRRIPDGLLNSLIVRGGGKHVSDRLASLGWNRSEPVASAVVTLDPDSGVVRGIRFETRGKLPEIRFPIKDLWMSASTGYFAVIRIDDMSTFKWMWTGEI